MKGLSLVLLGWALALQPSYIYQWDTRWDYAPSALLKEHGCKYLHQYKYSSKTYDEYSNDGFKYRIFYECPKKLPYKYKTIQ